MSHGRSMLEAQAQKERSSLTGEDGRLDDGHLRSGGRALKDDGTPVRPSRGKARSSGSGEAKDSVTEAVDDPAALRPRVQLGFGGFGSTSTEASDLKAEHNTGLRNSAPFSVILPTGRTEQASSSDVVIDAAPPPRFSASAIHEEDCASSTHPRAASARGTPDKPEEEGSSWKATAEIVIDHNLYEERRGAVRQDHLRARGSGSRSSSHDTGSQVRASGVEAGAAGARYAEKKVMARTSVGAASREDRDSLNTPERDRAASRSPPPVTSNTDKLFPSSSSSLLCRIRAAPPPTPVTAGLLRPSGTTVPLESPSGPAHTSAHACSPAGGGDDVDPVKKSAWRPAVGLPPTTPASPPLRAGVSPRMAPLHPTRTDPSNASLSLSRAASVSTTAPNVMANGAASNVLSASQASPFSRPGSQVSPLELPADAPHGVLPSQTDASCQDDYALERRAPDERSDVEAQTPDLSPQPLSQKVRGDAGPWDGVTRRGPPAPLPPLRCCSAETMSFPHRLQLSEPVDADGQHQSRDPVPRDGTECGTAPLLHDCSGFHNSGNDCYACSLLTMLLRSLVFRRALLESPLEYATRRCVALLTEKAERRAQWRSGYIDTSSSNEPYHTRLVPAKRARHTSFSVGQVDDTAWEALSAANVCGWSASLARSPPSAAVAREAPAEVEYVLPGAVQHTRAALHTFSLEELVEVLNVNMDTGEFPATLHSALVALLKAQRWRERIITVANASTTSAAERQRLLETKIYHRGDGDYPGRVYTNGIRLHPVASLLAGEFFIGDQEDAHELFVALMAKLETEAVDFQERCEAVLSLRHSTGDDSEEEALVKCPTPCSPVTLSVSTAPAEVWINALAQARLLNIIRCRAAGCRHEIVTDEVCVNLSLHIPEEVEVEEEVKNRKALHSTAPAPHTAAVKDESAARPPSYFPPHPPLATASPLSSVSATAVTSNTSPLAESATPASSRPSLPSVTSLLHVSMAYGALKDYRCDSCGSTAAQFQAGCLYTRPPPLLVVQLKRFAMHFEDGVVVVRKNGRRVAVEDVLELYALPSAAELQEWRQQCSDGSDGEDDRAHRNVDEPEAGTRANDKAAARRGESVLSSRLASGPSRGEDEGEERNGYYDPVAKCFTTALASAYDGVETDTEEHSIGADGAQAESLAQSQRRRPLSGLATSPPTSASSFPPSISSPSLIWAMRCVYRLRSCVWHLGDSLHYGHYIADFAVDDPHAGNASKCNEDGTIDKERFKEKGSTQNRRGVRGAEEDSTGRALPRCWRRANDAHVAVLSEEAVQARRAGHSDTYLLLYERVEEEWVRCPAAKVLPRPIYPSEENMD